MDAKPRSSFIYFSGINIYTLGLFRIAFGLSLLLDILFYKLPIIDAFFTDQSIIPSDTLSILTQTHGCSLLYYIGSTYGVFLFFCVTILLCVLYIIGFKTKITAILLYICLFSIHERAAPFLFGSDQIFRTILFWSIFLPLDKTFSFFQKNKQITVYEIRTVAVFAMLFQISSIYFFNAYNKSGNTWLDGTAIGYAMMIPQHRTLFSDVLLSSPLVYKFLTYFSLIFEFAILFLIFSPWFNKITRLISAILISGFHWGMLPFLNVGDFYLASIPLMVILLPVSIWQKLLPSFFLKNIENENLLVAEPKINKPKSFIINTFIISMTLVIFLISIINYKKLPKISIEKISKSCNCLGLVQGWNMFAPNPSLKNGYIVIIGQLSENSFINLRSGEPFVQSDLINHPFKYKSLPVEFNNLDNGFPQFFQIPELAKKISYSWAKYEYKLWRNSYAFQNLQKLYIARVLFTSEKPGVISKPTLIKLFEYIPEK